MRVSRQQLPIPACPPVPSELLKTRACCSSTAFCCFERLHETPQLPRLGFYCWWKPFHVSQKEQPGLSLAPGLLARSAWPCVYYDISQSRGEISVGGCLGDSAVGLCCLCLLCHGMVGLPQSHGPLVVFLAKSKDGITFLALNDYLASFLYH